MPHLRGADSTLPSPPEEPVRIGCAGWSIPGAHAAAFPGGGTHLERYARIFNAVEIDSSFYRPHRRATYEKWAASTPERFAFSVKIPKTISHVRRLVDLEEPLAEFFEQVEGLGSKLQALLVQLPPRLGFDRDCARRFFELLRERGWTGLVACEPRHADWFTPTADRLLSEWHVCRVAADPPPVPGGDRPGGWSGPAYYRLHGSPRRYYSAYPPQSLDRLAARLVERGGAVGSTWVIFDNTAAGAAVDNALGLWRRLGAR